MAPEKNIYRLTLGFVAAGIACTAGAIGVPMLFRHVYFASGLGAFPIAPILVLFAPWALVTLICFLSLWFCLSRGGLRISTFGFVVIPLLSLLIGLGSVLFGSPPTRTSSTDSPLA